ncbi:unnamed protein product [Agarophyton chilense]|eukprot:gb/GEZJ01004694.1/.p1 GENE.gb/GEZJ01004694.1/~~gb/GEZJ01004694.1/.p1  ORF type:complete len:502 (+),score=64.21 gb/GEZJ01004694.1/:898-2403(+)
MKSISTSLLFFFALLGLFIAPAECKEPKLKGRLFRRFSFTPIEDFTDEFRGRRFDLDKWFDINPRWRGRQPGLFATKNVRQRKGELRLRGRFEKSDKPFADAPEGYENYTTAFVQTRKLIKYGYFEVRAKPSNSRLSSAFWGSLDTPTLWTEIDVFEIGGGAVRDGLDFRQRINMNLHVFRNTKNGISPGVNEINKPTYYTHTKKLRSKFNTYGIDWSRKFITWTFNGRAIRKDRNTDWRQAFPIKLDVETMPFWFGLPSEETLPVSFKIKYIRTWSRKRRKTNEEETVRQFNMGMLPVSSLTAGMQDEEVDEEDDEDDEAVTEIEDMGTQTETQVPVDGLQRPPIPGSNERVYMPVTPLGGGSWKPIVEKVNIDLDDVSGTIFDSDEQIDMADFDEEKVSFGSFGKSLVPNGGAESEGEGEEESTGGVGDSMVPSDVGESESTGGVSGEEMSSGLPVGFLGRPNRPTSIGGSEEQKPIVGSGERGFGRVAGGFKLPAFGF